MVAFFYEARHIARMEKNELAMRLKRLGMTQADFAKRCGVTLRTAQHGIYGGVWQYVALIELLEMLTFEQRREWLDNQK